MRRPRRGTGPRARGRARCRSSRKGCRRWSPKGSAPAGSASSSARRRGARRRVRVPLRADAAVGDGRGRPLGGRGRGPRDRPGPPAGQRSSSTSRRCRWAPPSWSRAQLSQAGAANDVGVASNPEFLREGNAVRDFLQPSRVVIGCDDAAVAVRVSELYRDVQAPILVTDPASAEMIKYASNAFLATKISFINAIANLCEAVNADVREVALGMGYDPRIGFEFLHPGPGYGGSCFPKDTAALIHTAEAAGYDFSLLRGVVEVNRRQHERIIEKLRDAAGGSLQRRAPSACGASRSRPTPTTCATRRRWSCADGCSPRARTVRAYDPAAGEAAAAQRPDLDVVADPYEAVAGAQLLALLTEWDEFRWLDFARVADAMADAARARRRAATCSIPRRCAAAASPTRASAADAARGRHRRCRLRRFAPLRRAARARSGRSSRSTTSSPASVDNVAHLADDAGFTLVEHDVIEGIPVDGPVDAVLHFASPASPPRVPRAPDRDARGRRRSAPGTRSTSRARHGARFLLASTSEIYGDPLVHPQPESYFGNVNSVGPAVGLRRGEALRRGAHDGVPPRATPSTPRSCASSIPTGPASAPPTGASCRTSSPRRCGASRSPSTATASRHDRSAT